MPCGHLHRICTTGDLAGMPACDVEPWGAYTVGSIYALAALYSGKSGMDQSILQHLYIDQIGRVQLDPKDLLGGKYGKPDMSHRGYFQGPAHQ
jgi:hypothetical protein